MLGNPVPGHIQARGETWNRTGFIVTSTFAEHKASGRALGIDIGNGKEGSPVYAMADGTVSFSGGIQVTGMPTAALVVRIRHPQLDAQFGGVVATGYAHLRTIGVIIGARVTKGQVIGSVGMTGATAPHLHGGFTVNSVERDWWPLLDQNGGDMGTHVVNARLFLGADGTPTPKTISFAVGTYTGYTADGQAKTVTLAKASSAPADAVCQIVQTPKIAPNGSGFLHITAGAFADHPYVLQTQPGITVPPDPPMGGGYSQAELDAAVDKAEAEAGKEAATNTAAAAVAEARKYG